MKNKKAIIILILILLLIIIVISVIVKIMKKNKVDEQYAISENPKLTTSLDITKLNIETEFFTVENCINKYFNTLNENDIAGIYNLLNPDYIKKNSINESNILDKTYTLKNGFEEFFANDIYYREISYGQEYQYYIYGQLLGENYETIDNIYIIANLDFENMSFNISFDKKTEVDNLEYLNIVQNLKNNNEGGFINVEDSKKTQINLNAYNAIEEYINQDKYGLEHYLKHYCTMAVYYPEIGYSLLDEEYRNAKYNNIEEYKEHVSENMYELLYATLQDQRIFEKDGYMQFIIVDTNNNWYIFNQTDIMHYTVLTDFYTVDIEEIANNYDNSNVQGKGAINVQKVISALNNKDYKYVYSKLSEEFKKNNYPTFEQFKEYISPITKGKTIVSFDNFRFEGYIYIYDITLSGNKASSGDPVNMQIIMKLNENRDFEMSFNIKDNLEE